jgi:hypothetical protein
VTCLTCGVITPGHITEPAPVAQALYVASASATLLGVHVDAGKAIIGTWPQYRLCATARSGEIGGLDYAHEREVVLGCSYWLCVPNCLGKISKRLYSRVVL